MQRSDHAKLRSWKVRASALAIAAILAGCGSFAFPSPRGGGQASDPAAGPSRSTPGPRPSFAIRAAPDPGSACVLHPNPANGGHPEPPAEVVAAGDPTKPTGVVEVTTVGLGDVVLPSDRLLVNDLFAMSSYFLPDMPAVQLHGFTGRAPVCLHIARFEPADQRAAFLHIRLVDAPVDHWVIGTAGLGVDGGVGGIGSAEAVQAVTSDSSADVYLEALQAHDVNTWSWANIVTDPASGANVVGFSTGYGDGGYPVYAGIGQDGRVDAVVIDLLVLPWRWLALVGPVPSS